jgi:DNA-binding transcriptional regulator YiaG
MQKKVTAGGIQKLEHFDKPFVAKLEQLYVRTGLSSYTAYAEFLGVTYATLCNWRSGRYQKSNEFPKNSIDAYLRLSDEDLNALVVERNVE